MLSNITSWKDSRVIGPMSYYCRCLGHSLSKMEKQISPYPLFIFIFKNLVIWLPSLDIVKWPDTKEIRNVLQKLWTSKRYKNLPEWSTSRGGGGGGEALIDQQVI